MSIIDSNTVFVIAITSAEHPDDTFYMNGTSAQQFTDRQAAQNMADTLNVEFPRNTYRVVTEAHMMATLDRPAWAVQPDTALWTVAYRAPGADQDTYMTRMENNSTETQFWASWDDAHAEAERMNNAYPALGYHVVGRLDMPQSNRIEWPTTAHAVRFRAMEVGASWGLVVTDDGQSIRTFATHVEADSYVQHMQSEHGEHYQYEVTTLVDLNKYVGQTHHENTVADLNVVIERLNAQITTLQSDLRQERQEHRDDVRMIGDHMIVKAEENNLCPVFDDAVDYLNARIHVQLPTREKDYTVTYRVTVDVPISVSARNETAARDQAYENLNTAEVISVLRNDGWEDADFWSIEQDD